MVAMLARHGVATNTWERREPVEHTPHRRRLAEAPDQTVNARGVGLAAWGRRTSGNSRTGETHERLESTEILNQGILDLYLGQGGKQMGVERKGR